MQYQFELKVHTRVHNIKSADDDFMLYVYRAVDDDFKLAENNSRTTLLQAYVRSVYKLYLQSKSINTMIHKIEMLQS